MEGSIEATFEGTSLKLVYIIGKIGRHGCAQIKIKMRTNKLMEFDWDEGRKNSDAEKMSLN